METVRFYFSFRSPYSWFAFRRIERALAGLPAVLDYVPIFPPEDYPNDPRANPAKLAYVREDVARFAAAYGLRMKMPESFDTDWIRPHAAYLFAADRGRSREFANALYELRFCQGRDVGEDAAIAHTARAAALDGRAAAAAAADPAFQARVRGGFERAREDKVFGAPHFVYRGEGFWGNDRIEWLVRAIARDSGRPVPDLAADPLAQPCGEPAEAGAPESQPIS